MAGTTDAPSGEEAGGRQAARSRETRQRIIDAAVSCVDQQGFARTTVQRIAREAGLTAGAVQHHFDSKADVLRAVLERSFEHFRSCFEGVSPEGAALEARVATFVDRAWQHCGSPTFRSTLEILLTTRANSAATGGHWSDAPMAETAQQADALWRWLFSDVPLDEDGHRAALAFAFAALNGIAIGSRLQTDPVAEEAQLDLLKSALLSTLERR